MTPLLTPTEAFIHRYDRPVRVELHLIENKTIISKKLNYNEP